MNTKMKRRMIATSGVIIVVLIVILAVVGGNTAATSISVEQAVQGSYDGKKVQVTGNVVPESYTTKDNGLWFAIYDPDNPTAQLEVVYDGAASSTFGNDVTAICTGRLQDDGLLQCSELVTKCPSKYESSTDALSIDRLQGYGDTMIGTMVKVKGLVMNGTLNPAGTGDRFILIDSESGNTLPIHYEGALADVIADGSAVVLTGSLNDDGGFNATEVALEG